MVDYPAGWTCERTRIRFEHYLLSTLLLREALADLLVRFSRWIARERAAAEVERELAAKVPL